MFNIMIDPEISEARVNHYTITVAVRHAVVS
jgi:hypothetical protein